MKRGLIIALIVCLVAGLAVGLWIGLTSSEREKQQTFLDLEVMEYWYDEDHEYLCFIINNPNSVSIKFKVEFRACYFGTSMSDPFGPRISSETDYSYEAHADPGYETYIFPCPYWKPEPDDLIIGTHYSLKAIERITLFQKQDGEWKIWQYLERIQTQ